MKNTYQIVMPGTNRFIKHILGFLMILFIMQSCKKNDALPKGTVTATPKLTASTDSLTLNRSDSSKTVLTFNWTPGQVKGLTGRLAYILEIDKKGNNFANAVQLKIGGDTVKLAMTTKQLNNLLGAFPSGVALAYEVRIVTATSDGSVMPFFSNILNLNLTTYSKVPYSQLWLVGDATPGGWSLNAASPMVQDATNPFVFSWTGALVPGEFKIATALDFSAPFFRPLTNHPNLSVTTVTVTASNANNPDNKWAITSANTGNYKITLNLQTNTITIVDTDMPAYTQLWLIGDATAGGWSLNAMTPLVLSSTDPFTFTYTGAFVPGEFKIATAPDFGAPFYRPLTNHPDLLVTSVTVYASDATHPDNKWQITTAGNYAITLNIRNSGSISIVKQ